MCTVEKVRRGFTRAARLILKTDRRAMPTGSKDRFVSYVDTR